MRADCRHCESRTYGSGEVVRRCKLDLAPEAPWRCPDDCAGYAVRRMDAGWHYGSLAQPQPAPETEPVGEDVAALLDAAEDIVNAAALGHPGRPVGTEAPPPAPQGQERPVRGRVRAGGVEPPRPEGHRDLNPARLPFRHARVPPSVATLLRASVRPMGARIPLVDYLVLDDGGPLPRRA